MDRIGNLDRIFIGCSQDVDHDGWLPVEAGDHLSVFEPILDVCKVTDPDLSAVCGGDHDISKVLLRVGLAIGANHDRSNGRPQRAGGEGKGRSPNCSDKIFE